MGLVEYTRDLET